MSKEPVDIFVYKQKKAAYADYPCNPEEIYPEFSEFNLFQIDKSKENENYRAIRDVFLNLGLDKDNFGTSSWNPLKEKIKKGQKVVIKPNLVYHEHPLGEDAVLSMTTNAAIIRPIIDYILLATEGEVRIVIGDAPVQGCDFGRAIEISGIRKLVQFYLERGISIELIDFRLLISRRNKDGILAEKIENPKRDRSMYKTVDLKEKSELINIISKSDRFEITDYGYGSVKRHHNQYKNEYIIPKEILEADLFINVPKLKTHRKAGLTCAMKNLVGINGDKTCIAHHTRGSSNTGGDEFNRINLKVLMRVRIWSFLKTNRVGINIAGLIKRFFERYVWHGKSLKEHRMNEVSQNFFEGSWHGNDTIWRCVKDLNKILLYADKRGNMNSSIQRKYLCIVDAVLAGEGEGPMEQSTKKFGVIFGGNNPAYIDLIAAKLMKYDYRRIPVVNQAFKNCEWPLVTKGPNRVVYASNKEFSQIVEYFVPTCGWKAVLKEHVD